jgi:hypothetical protein
MPEPTGCSKEPGVTPIHEILVSAVCELGRAHGLLSEILGDPEAEDAEKRPTPATVSSLAKECQDRAIMLADRLAILRDRLGGSL